MDIVEKLVKQNAVVIFSLNTCCICYAMKRFFRDLGVKVIVYELDHEVRGKDMEREIASMMRRSLPVSAMFIGGCFVGPTERVIAHHLNGALVHMLREAGTLDFLDDSSQTLSSKRDVTT